MQYIERFVSIFITWVIGEYIFLKPILSNEQTERILQGQGAEHLEILK